MSEGPLLDPFPDRSKECICRAEAHSPEGRNRLMPPTRFTLTGNGSRIGFPSPAREDPGWSGGTGRRTRLKIWRPKKAWGFDSPLQHQKINNLPKPQQVSLFLGFPLCPVCRRSSAATDAGPLPGRSNSARIHPHRDILLLLLGSRCEIRFIESRRIQVHPPMFDHQSKELRKRGSEKSHGRFPSDTRVSARCTCAEIPSDVLFFGLTVRRSLW